MEKTLKKRTVKEVITSTVDNETGELLETRDVKEFRVDGEPEYVKLYLSDVSRLFGLSAGCSSVMYELLSRMDYDNLIAVTPMIRKVIAMKAGTSVDVINHTIAKLVAEGVFTKIGSGTYMANPDLFGKGKWVDIKNMRLCITYDQNGRTFKASRNIEQQLEIEGEGFEQAKPISGMPGTYSIWRLS